MIFNKNMQKKYLPFSKTGYFSLLICDYLDEKPELKEFYNNFPNIENFKKQIEEKQLSFKNESRNTLVSVLTTQYKTIEASDNTLKNIESLRQGKTFEIIIKEKDEKVALSKAKDMCEKLLANLTIEDYSVKAIKE